MAKAIKGIITGIPELNEAFRQFPLKIQKKALRPALRESAKIVAARARQLIPVDTGKAKDTIKVTALKRSRIKLGIKIGAGSNEADGGLPYYVKWLEFGTKVRTTKKGANRGRIRPGEAGGFIGLGKRKGFLRVSLDESRKKVNEKFRTEIQKTIREIRSKL